MKRLLVLILLIVGILITPTNDSAMPGFFRNAYSYSGMREICYQTKATYKKAGFSTLVSPAKEFCGWIYP